MRESRVAPPSAVVATYRKRSPNFPRHLYSIVSCKPLLKSMVYYNARPTLYFIIAAVQEERGPRKASSSTNKITTLSRSPSDRRMNLLIPKPQIIPGITVNKVRNTSFYIPSYALSQYLFQSMQNFLRPWLYPARENDHRRDIGETEDIANSAFQRPRCLNSTGEWEHCVFSSRVKSRGYT